MSLIEFGSGLGIRVIEHPNLPRTPNWPDGLIQKQPWWLSDEAWARHRRWIGEFFGWRQDSYLISGSAFSPLGLHSDGETLCLMSPEKVAQLRQVTRDPQGLAGASKRYAQETGGS